MRVARWLLTIVLGVLLLVDGIVAYRLIRYGWPKRLVISAADSVAQIQAVPVGMNGAGWALIAAYALVHILLCYCVWRLWQPSRRAVHL